VGLGLEAARFRFFYQQSISPDSDSRERQADHVAGTCQHGGAEMSVIALRQLTESALDWPSVVSKPAWEYHSNRGSSAIADGEPDRSATQHRHRDGSGAPSSATLMTMLMPTRFIVCSFRTKSPMAFQVTPDDSGKHRRRRYIWGMPETGAYEKIQGRYRRLQPHL
jgi:hypothetical protein